MDGFTIYHNPRWGKSRQTLQLLRDNGVEPQIIEYLKNTPTADDLKDLSGKLGKGPSEFVRKGEADFKENNMKDVLSDDNALFRAMAQFPKVMERPIVVKGDRAVLGRPPENVLELLWTVYEYSRLYYGRDLW